MRLVQVPSVITPVASRRRRCHARLRRFGLLLIGLLVLAETGLYFRPFPPATLAVTTPPSVAPGEVQLAWPATGQAAISAAHFNFLASNAPQASVSTASMAKLITALCILEKKPIAAGQSGPVVTMRQADVDRYDQEVQQGGSSLAIVLGEQLTERQMLEAMLLPSANNIANTAAIWAFGSLANYQNFATQYVQNHGLTSTTIGPDASGFDPTTKSTTGDLTQLAKLALTQPTIVAIAKEPSATFTTAGTVENRDYLLADGILTGLKTGMNDGNSGSFVFTANVQSGTVTHIMTGAIVNDNGSLAAVADAETLAKSAADDFETITLPKNTTIGTIRSAWGDSAPLVTERDITVMRWKATKVYYYDTTSQTTGAAVKTVGSLHIKTDGASAETPIILTHDIAQPSVWWRLTTLR